MPDIFIFIPLLIFPIVGGIFIYITLSSRKLIPQEVGNKPLLKVTCGGWIGSLSMTAPFVSLRFYEDFLVIGAIQKYFLRYSEISAVIYKRQVFSKGISFEHSDANTPARLIIFSFEATSIMGFLRKKVRVIES